MISVNISLLSCQFNHIVVNANSYSANHKFILFNGIIPDVNNFNAILMNFRFFLSFSNNQLF